MTDLRRFDLNLLIAFDVLMRELSVSRAAEKMFITQSSMSHVLQRLRRQLDDPVLVRTSSGMQPTERALSLVDPVRAILREVEQVIQPPADFDPATSQRRFAIAATDYMEFLLLARLVERAAQSAPGICIHVKRTETPFPVDALESGDLDVVLGFGTILNPPLHCRSQVLFDDRMACLVRADHPAVGDRLSLDEYLALPHLLISRTGAKRGIIDEWLSERGLERRVALIVPHFLSAPFIVARTNLLLSLPFRIAENFSRLAALKILPVPMELPPYDLVMIWHPVRNKEPSHCWLRRQIVEVCPGQDFVGRSQSTAGDSGGQ